MQMMEEERQRRINEDPNSPAMAEQMVIARQQSQKEAIKMMEMERKRRVGEEIEVEATAQVQRRKSIETVVKATEQERARRIKPGAGAANYVAAAVFALSAIALSSLLVLTFEDTLFAPPPPPPPEPRFFGFF